MVGSLGLLTLVLVIAAMAAPSEKTPAAKAAAPAVTHHRRHLTNEQKGAKEMHSIFKTCRAGRAAGTGTELSFAVAGASGLMMAVAGALALRRPVSSRIAEESTEPGEELAGRLTFASPAGQVVSGSACVIGPSPPG
jgi:hypothetical protein